MARDVSTSSSKSEPPESSTPHLPSEEPFEEEPCGITEVIEILSRKWTLIILRSLGFHESLRFNELNKKCGDISPRTLAKRLRELRKYGIIHRTQFNEIPPKVVYSLSLKGIELVHSFKQLDDWAKKWNIIPP
ncbi:MAG: winged helix-turn-helix transcriptional regulator [Candidatus Thorarchaeota archaeon]